MKKKEPPSDFKSNDKGLTTTRATASQSSKISRCLAVGNLNALHVIVLLASGTQPDLLDTV